MSLTQGFPLPVVIHKALLIEWPEDFRTQLSQLGLFLLPRGSQPLAKLHHPLGEDDPILTEPPTNLVDEGRPRVHQPLADPMKGLEVLRRELLDRHKAHRRPCNRFPNGFGIRHIVLIGFDIGFEKWGAINFTLGPCARKRRA